MQGILVEKTEQKCRKNQSKRYCFKYYTQTCFSQLSLKLGMYEAGFTMAPSNFLGDLGGNPGKGGTLLKDNNLSNTKLLVGAHINLFPTEWYAIRFALNYGTIAGDDALIKGKGGEEVAELPEQPPGQDEVPGVPQGGAAGDE